MRTNFNHFAKRRRRSTVFRDSSASPPLSTVNDFEPVNTVSNTHCLQYKLSEVYGLSPTRILDGSGHLLGEGLADDVGIVLVTTNRQTQCTDEGILDGV